MENPIKMDDLGYHYFWLFLETPISVAFTSSNLCEFVRSFRRVGSVVAFATPLRQPSSESCGTPNGKRRAMFVYVVVSAHPLNISQNGNLPQVRPFVDTSSIASLYSDARFSSSTKPIIFNFWLSFTGVVTTGLSAPAPQMTWRSLFKVAISGSLLFASKIPFKRVTA